MLCATYTSAIATAAMTSTMAIAQVKLFVATVRAPSLLTGASVTVRRVVAVVVVTCSESGFICVSFVVTASSVHRSPRREGVRHGGRPTGVYRKNCAMAARDEQQLERRPVLAVCFIRAHVGLITQHGGSHGADLCWPCDVSDLLVSGSRGRTCHACNAIWADRSPLRRRALRRGNSPILRGAVRTDTPNGQHRGKRAVSQGPHAMSALPSHDIDNQEHGVVRSLADCSDGRSG